MPGNVNSESLPHVDKIVVYLDYNVFVSAAHDENRLGLLKALADTDYFIFPFTHIHVQEINRIASNEKEKIKKRLTVIKSITKSNYLDFNQSVGQFTIRERDPFELYQTINEVPQDFIDGISKYATETYLRPTLPNLPSSCFKGEDLFAHFIEQYRSEFPNLAIELNNLNKNDAVKYLKEKIYSGFSFEKMYETMTKILKDHGLGEMTYEDFLDLQLYIAGYKTPNSDLKKPGGLMSDHQHIYFAQNCPIVISNDKNFRRKLRAKFDSSQKLVIEPKLGIVILGVMSGLMVAKDSSGREIDISELKSWALKK